MDTLSSFISHEHPLVDVQECIDLLYHFSSLLFCFYWLLLLWTWSSSLVCLCGEIILECKWQR